MAYTIIAPINQTAGMSMITLMYLRMTKAMIRIDSMITFLIIRVVKGRVMFTLLPRRLLKNSRILLAS